MWLSKTVTLNQNPVSCKQVRIQDQVFNQYVEFYQIYEHEFYQNMEISHVHFT